GPMKRSAAGILALALAACAVGPDYQRPEAAVSAAYKEAVGWKVAEPRDEASRGNWWEIFGDPKLSALIENIDMSNQNVLLAEARFRQAQALAAQSRAALFPTLDDTVTAFDKSLELTRNRYAAGVAAKVDVVQAETQLKSTLAQSIDTGVQRAQLEHAIAILIGKLPSELSIAPVPLAVTMPRVPLGLPTGL